MTLTEFCVQSDDGNDGDGNDEEGGYGWVRDCSSGCAGAA